MKNVIFTLLVLTQTTSLYAQNLSSILNKISKITSVNESTCSDIDLRSEAIGANRDQGTTGWCFAYATSDLITNNTSQKVSAVSLAFGFYENLQPDVPGIKLSKLAGGNDQAAISFAQNEFCLEEDMPSSNYVSSECNFKTNDPTIVMQKIENFLDAKKAFNTCEINITKTLFKNLTESEIDLVASNKNLSTYKKMFALNKLNCQSRKYSTNKLALKPGFNSSPNLTKDIDKQIDNKNPVNINYNAGFLLEKTEANVVYNHYSTVFGRRLNKETNTCEYLIRNTWGSNCSLYPKALQAKCEEGSIWIDKDTLNKNLIGVTSIK